MLKNLRCIALIACVFAPPIGCAHAAQVNFAVSNTTSVAVVSIELNSQDRADVQPVVSLAANVGTGEQQDFVAEVTDGACLFAAVFVLADGSHRERKDLDLCEYSVVSIE